ncbi:MAG: hypothetical protein WD397_00705 [Wenzhouxiangellaceae bacterium]
MRKLLPVVVITVLALCGSGNANASPAHDNPSPAPESSASMQTPQNDGQTIPRPVFQLGDTPSTPFPDESERAKAFVDFFNQTYFADSQITLPLLTKSQVVWFPPQTEGDTSLELVVRTTAGETANCEDPQGYPIVCDDDFSTGEFCKACHDSVLFVEGGGLPQMAYFSEPDFTEQHETWLANWSQYGDWNANIMRLATRDPIWQAQIETETNKHPYADPAVIQDVCFSCHGEMGERQLKFDHGAEQVFCTDIFYATIPGLEGDFARGKPYVPTGDCEPIPDKPIADHPNLYAKYGALARDGVSCETCHRIGPENGRGRWDGTDFSIFYGMKNPGPDAPIPNVSRRQTANPNPLEYEFTATFDYDMQTIMAPDTTESLDTEVMLRDDNLHMAQALNEATGDTYLGQAVICGTCHVLIVPQIPTAFKPEAPVPASNDPDGKYPFYKRPDACDKETFDKATNGIYGNPLTDNCVALGYEQATYLEWINSDFASEEDNENTCQGCHMPLVTNPNDPTDHTAIMAQSTQGLTPKDYRRHRLMGINLPVFEMFVQFPEVLGIATFDDLVPPLGISITGEEAKFVQHALLNGQMAIVEQATSQANGNGLQPDSGQKAPQAATEIVIDDLTLNSNSLTADITVINNAGHKFPSGAGFRRGFLRFEVFNEAGALLWVSGATNPFGAICNGPCKQDASGKYNLLDSEVTGGDPAKLQPHHSIITRQSQVQIYEVQAVDDTGTLTSRTLSLFYDAKDNRLLPRGFKQPGELGCEENSRAGTEIFGIAQCSAAYATESQIEMPLTIGSSIAADPHYTDSTLAGSDQISYHIPLADMNGTPNSIRVTMEYQTIPPSFLASRFEDGFDKEKNAFLQATERSIYLTSHLNTDLALKSEHPENPDLTFSRNWTTSIYQTASNIDRD